MTNDEPPIKNDASGTTHHALPARIRQAMREAFPPSDDPVIVEYYQLMEYHLGWRDTELVPVEGGTGKLIRPQLALLACRALGGAEQQALPVAAALQLLHDFSLIHDDIEDHSEQRRGRPTLWRLCGIEVAINAGDGMFALAHRALYRLQDAGVDPLTVLAVARGFEQAALRICEGQHLDMTGEGRFDVDEDRYLRMIRGKTATLLSAATGLGARLASDDTADVAAMYEFGEALGMGFQMRDDLLDIWGDPRDTGKPFAADLLQRKMSLPMIHAYGNAGADRATIERIYRGASVTEADVQVLLGILEATGSRAHVAALAERQHDHALAALDRVTPVDVEAYAELRALTEALLIRAN